MNEDVHLKLQAYLDGELSAAERADVESLLARDAEARALIAELRNTSGALVGYEAEVKLPESREFYWSKIQREISRPAAPTAAAGFSLGDWLRRMLVPAGAVAAVAVTILLALPQTKSDGVAFTDATDAVAFTYHNYETGATLVWLDYPAENDFAEPAAADTIDL